jgi:WD40 repeat protein
MAVVNSGSSTLQVFPFNGSSIGSPYSKGTDAGPQSVSWSPDGRFMAVVNNNAWTLQVFSFNGSSNPVQIGNSFSIALPNAVSWSPDGRFIAVLSEFSSLVVFLFNGSSTPIQIDIASTGSSPQSVSWSSDSRFIAVSNSGSSALQVFPFNGSSIGNPYSTLTGYGLNQAAWDPTGNFIAAVNGLNVLRVFLFNGYTPPIQVGSGTGTGSNPDSVSWSSDGRFIAVANQGSKTLQVFELNYIPDSSAQAISNGLVFGNSGMGAAYDATVNILAGANINVDGLVNYDSVV